MLNELKTLQIRVFPSVVTICMWWRVQWHSNPITFVVKAGYWQVLFAGESVCHVCLVHLMLLVSFCFNIRWFLFSSGICRLRSGQTYVVHILGGDYERTLIGFDRGRRYWMITISNYVNSKLMLDEGADALARHTCSCGQHHSGPPTTQRQGAIGCSPRSFGAR